MPQSAPPSPPRYAVILAGGIGSRFWPASTPDRPKQLLPLGGDRPLIVETIERARQLVGHDRVRVLSGPELVEPFRRVVPDLAPEHFLLEPVARSTAPVLVRAAAEIEARDPGALMVSLHADHAISPFEGFRETIDRAAAAAEGRGSLVCVGIEPTRPETGYGYVLAGTELDPGVHAADRFIEKPDLETARRFVADGRFLWNTGIFVWRARDLLAAARRWTRELSRAFPRLDAGDVEGFFREAEPVSVDVGVLERAEDVEVARASFGWDDVGTWASLARTRQRDRDGNAVVGTARVVEGTDNVVWAEGGRIVLFGVSDLVVVRSGEETLVTTRERASQLKRLLARLATGEEGP
jgi:mannose-1-phosphate guanylyltransferase